MGTQEPGLTQMFSVDHGCSECEHTIYAGGKIYKSIHHVYSHIREAGMQMNTRKYKQIHLGRKNHCKSIQIYINIYKEIHHVYLHTMWVCILNMNL